MAVFLPYSLQSLPKSQSSDWVRPSDWPVITDTANEIWALVNDQGAGYISFTANFIGNAAVDWGDGATQSITSGTAFTHYYTKGAGTPCSRGYTTFKVRIYPTDVSFAGWVSVRPTYATPTASNGTNLGGMYSIGLLEMYYGEGVGVGAAGSYFASPSGSGIFDFQQLEYVKFPSTVLSFGMNFMFQNCAGLQKVILPTTIQAGTVNFASAFIGCANLKSVVMPTTISITSLASAFQNCYSLKSVIFPGDSSLTACTTLNSAFASCFNLINMDLPAITSCLNIQSAFQNCYNLQSFRFKGLPSFGSATTVTATSVFSTCLSLESIIFPTTCSSNANYSLSTGFQNCYSLKEIVLPSGFNPSTLANAFDGNYNLQKVIFQSDCPSLTTMSNTFLNCYSLTSVTLPTNVANATTIICNAIFYGCGTLGSMTIPWSNISTITSGFFGCSNLKTVSIPNATGITNFGAIFSGCSQLVNVTLPSTLNSATLNSLNNAFTGCYSLKSIVIPSMTSSATTTSAFTATFQNCYSLQSVTFSAFGTASISAATGQFVNTFQNCYSLKNVDLTPLNTLTIFISGGSISDNMLQNCWSLESAKISTVLNGAATTTGTPNAASLISNCQSLETIDTTNLFSTSTQNLTWTNTFTAAGSGTITAGRLIGLTFSCRFAKFSNNGVAAAKMNLQSLRLLNTAAGQWGGTSPQISVAYTMMGQSALVQLFNDLTTVTAKTIDITGCPGASLLTAGERAIATGKGWTITG